VIKFQEEIRGLLDEYQTNCERDVTDVMRKSQIIYNPAEVNRFGNKFNIDFDFGKKENDELDIIFFSTLLNKELLLHKLPHVGNMEEWRSRLRAHLLIEEHLQRLKEVIERTQEGKEAALVLIKQVVPCIMHTENQGGEKIRTVLLSIGAAGYQSERISDSLERYTEQIQHIVQTRILGTEWCPKLWWFPLKENKNEVCRSSG
jgi:hypothetical protein